MKVLIISKTDSGGGAAIAAVRLCDELNTTGINAKLYVEEKKTQNNNIILLPKKKPFILFWFLRKLEEYIVRFCFQTTNNILHTANIFSVCDVSWINHSDFDVVNLHWINGTVSIKDISKINKRIIWTMHDSWPCCGAEHHPNIIENDKRWQEGYFKNNKPKSTHGIDVCRIVWNKKKKYLSDKNIIFTAPSNWEKYILKTSALFNKNQCEVIPNILPFSVFFPRKRETIRLKYGIPENKKCIGFGAAYRIDNPKSMKGLPYLFRALQLLTNEEDIFLILFGPAGNALTRQLTFDYYMAGYVKESNKLAELYSCCDCFVNSSLIENLSNTTYEALACGTPVVAFDVGGTRDLISHKKNGYLVQPYNINGLVEGIKYCFKFLNDKEKISHDIRSRFSKEEIMNRYRYIYTQ